MADIISKWRNDFDVFHSTMNGKEFVFLDTAASAQKPRAVVEALGQAYSKRYANIHRGLYAFSQEMTMEFERTRTRVDSFLSLPSSHHVIFTRNATESFNLLAHSWGDVFLNQGDEIILSSMEHHANIVPWQMIAQKTGAVIKYIPLNDRGALDVESLNGLLSPRTKLISLVHISNALGVVNDVVRIFEMVRAYNSSIVTVVDASQSIVHGAQSWDSLGQPDFIAFTGHKLYGPTGVGVLIGRASILDRMSPYQGGGDMIDTVSFDGFTVKESPTKFEAGTPAIAEVIALHAAIDYIDHAFQNGAAAHENQLANYLMDSLREIDGIEIYAPDVPRAGIISFNLNNIHHADVAMTLDQMGIAVRTGHHCCMPLMSVLGVSGTVRASLGLYSNGSDVDALCAGLKKVKTLFG